MARQVELARVRDALHDSSGVLITGEAGVGKTAFAGAVAAEFAAAGGSVLWLGATEASRLTPYGVLGPLLPPDLGALHPALVPTLVIQRLREGGRVLLAVDDAQLLDGHSAAALLAAATAGAARTLVTLRTGVPVSDAVTALWKDGLLDRLDLDRLDRAGARALLVDRLGGEVASGTVELLWNRSEGNPLYLTELARFGVESGRLRRDAGIWWWHGRTELPPRLTELLRRRLDDVSPAARDAMDVLALGEPLPWDTLAALGGSAAILELDERGLVVSDERAGVVWLRFSHPLLHTVAADRLTPARRHALAERLCRAPARHVDVIRRAGWEEAAAEPDLEVLLSAADALMLSDPAAAARFAERAAGSDRTPRAAVALSAAHAELGQLEPARRALRLAADRVHDERDRLAVGFEEVSLSLWTGRDPAAARDTLAGLAAQLGADWADEIETAAALVLLFSARPADALARADAVLAGRAAGGPRLRALTVRVAALSLADRPAEALTAANELVAALATVDVPATRAGLAHAVIAQARLLAQPDAALPPASDSGRWPAALTGPGPGWPLLEGMRRHLRGDWAGAVVPLREAYVLQRTGEGLFRSEALAGLVVVLADVGEADEAADLLDRHPPDGVAVVAGLRRWASAAVAAATERRGSAGELALAAAAEAVEAGAPATAVGYLADAARYGGRRAARAAAHALDGVPTASDLSRTRAAGVRARATGDPGDLLDAAERHLALGLLGHAAELADLARGRGLGRDPDRRAAAVAGRCRAGLGQPGAGADLTPREREIAQLAAAGRSDQAIADALVVSVRTVGSHLAAAYRKLGIRSRRELAGALSPATPASERNR